MPEYLLLVFYAMERELDRYTFGATIKTIGMPDVRKLTLALPPVEEQEAIAKNAFAVIRQLDQLLGKAASAVSLLQERRTALISAAVTGQIDITTYDTSRTDTPIPT